MQIQVKLARAGLALLFVLVPGVLALQGCASQASSTTVYTNGGPLTSQPVQYEGSEPYVDGESTTVQSSAQFSAAGYEAAVASGSDEAVCAYGQYRDGVYTASAEGKAGTVWVTVTIEGGCISQIVVDGNTESPAMAQKAQETVLPQILENQSTDGIDAASGATFTSDAIVEATSSALERASW